ncbi:MAG: helix-turn-helix transcriptional regulator [Bacillota bacterium]|nr:helix-turn-helix transcriptional regulator [Bacillota bacterium]
MYPKYEDIVNNIKSLIKRKGIKQGVIAVRAGFTPQDFSNMLNERRKLIRIEHLPIIADALEVDVNDLLNVSAEKG